MKPSHSTIFALFLAVLLAGAVISSARGHDIYHEWKVPANPSVSCCNDKDCRPTRAYLDNDGFWQAWNGEKWLRVPEGALLPTDHAKDGRSHLCSWGDHVYCFTPGEPRI